ncbi:peroxiredoxin-like family protein [Ekhidna sp. To15]|uniref:peroxiredoxin-like family protein n=1 Tax=Ekhidna sp. To15 TaxID=3395267 RepID=UPI003F5284C5
MTTDNRITLDINAPAPIFKLDDIFDREIDLSKYKGKRVLIAFFRHAGCPFCNTRVHNLEKHNEELKKSGFEMIFFFESKKDLLLSSNFHKSISPIPLISDPEKKWYDAYGVESSGLKSAKSHFTSFFKQVFEAKKKNLPIHWMSGDESIKTIPAEFLMDERGIIRKVHYAKGLRDRMAIDEIIKFAQG